MRTLAHPIWLLAAGCAAACGPKATVQRTTPLANLQSYRAVAVRVAAVPEASMQVGPLQYATATELQKRCSFERVLFGPQAEGQPVDLVLDLNIQRAFRGGEGFLRNDNLATIEVLLVMSDGVNGEIVGSAQIHGQSSAVVITGRSSPEQQAVGVVAETIAEMLGKSGCQGPRVARVEEPPPETNPGGADAGGGAEPDAHAQAEVLNDQGKERFRTADLAGAMELFRRAVALYPDPRYSFNICLAYEAQSQFAQAIESCDQVLAMKPPAALADKVKQRLVIIRAKQSGK